MSNAGWWYRASTDQRKAQVVGGSQCGMTARQIAWNCGCRISEPQRNHVEGFVIYRFARYHNIPLPTSDRHEAGDRAYATRRRIRDSIADIRRAYFSGEPFLPFEADQ